jgi:hypothetical protein
VTEPVRLKAYKKRGAGVAGLAGLSEQYRLACAECDDLPIIATVYDSDDGTRVDLLRSVVWKDTPGEYVEDAPPFAWVVLTLDQISTTVPLACADCGRQTGVAWADVERERRHRPRRNLVRIRGGAVVTM